MMEDSRQRKTGFLTARLLARNTAFNLSGEVIAVVIGAICVPYVVKRLGAESFGILSLSWSFLAYITLFDLGLSRATTKFVAEAVSRDNLREIPRIVWTSVIFQFLFGVCLALICGLNSHLLVARVLKIQPQLVTEAERGFQALAIAIPFVLVTNCLRGMLEGLQHFHLITYVKVSTNVLMFASPFFLIPFGRGVASIIFLITLIRIASMLAYLAICWPFLQSENRWPSFKTGVFRHLMTYGGWITVSMFVGPILLYSDRFAIGALMSVAAVAYYTGPADMLNRALVVPASLGSTLFPAFSSLEAAGEMRKLEDLYARSLKYLIVVMGPPFLLIGAFSRQILNLWLGPVFANRGSTPLEILSIATFLSCLSILPYGLLQGAGKPKITAIFHVLELPLHLGLVWVLVAKMGLTGAAIALAVRVLIDAVLVLWACDHFKLASFGAVHSTGVTRSIIGLAFLVLIVISVRAVSIPISVSVTVAVALAVLYCFSQWHWSFDHRDRSFLLSLVGRARVRSIPLRAIPESYFVADPSKVSETE
jgi:O-antigen/teichoic acid export membrane protein